MAIPSVVQGLIQIEGGKVFELDSPKGAAWLESIGSFRFEPAGGGKPCTVRREGSGYWYGCRKVAGKVRKKYIGKSSEVSIAKLEEIAAALEVPPVQRVGKVAEVAQEVAQVTQVAEVAEVAQDRLTALELEVASLRKALEALQEALPGKLESGDSAELPKVADEVAHEVADKVAEELQNELSNLKTENENLRRQLESSDRLVSRKNQEISELNSRLAGANQKISDSDEELSKQFEELERQDAEIHNLKSKIQNLESELARRSGENSEKSAAASELPEAADLLNQLKTRRKKSKTDLADIEAILEMIEES